MELLLSLPLLWGVVVGTVYSTVGAAGGTLASFGLISLFGLGDPNQVKPMAQILTLITPLIAVPLYISQCRVVYLLSFLLGAGGVVGAIAGSTLSTHYLADMSHFKPAFALLTLFIAGQMGWQLFRHYQRGNPLTTVMRAAGAFERHIKKGGDSCDLGVSWRTVQWREISFCFGQESFHFTPLLPIGAGFVIALFSSTFGVGGGFLLVPFMSMVMGLPMYIIAGTAALAISIHTSVSIANYIHLGAVIDFTLLEPIAIGVVIGSLIGPWVSRLFPENGLRALLMLVLLLIALRYLGVGFSQT